MDVSLPILLAPVLVAAFLATASPGPATMAIARESMVHGRRAGILLALGVTTGSWTWSALAAGGMSALMLAHGWTLDLMRILAALYLGWLAWKSGRAAMSAGRGIAETAKPPAGRSYARGLMIHLTNPKAILFFGALYSVGLPPDTAPTTVFLVAGAVAVQSLVIFVSLALLFSQQSIALGYSRLKRWFEAVFATVFGAASIGFLIAVWRRASP